jgi:hypothetical protein
MPSWTLGDLCSHATKRIGQRADISTSDVSLWVNQAYQDVVREIPEWQSEKTHYFSVSSGDSLVAMPNDCHEIVVISYQTTAQGSNRTLRQVSPEWADAQGYWPVGEPKGYFIWHDQLQLWPSADSSANTTVSSGRSYLMRYIATPTDMSATTDVPSIATEHRHLILIKSEVYLHQLLGNHEEAALAQANYLNFVTTLKDAIARRQATKTRFAISLPDRAGRRPRDSEEDDVWLRY